MRRAPTTPSGRRCRAAVPDGQAPQAAHTDPRRRVRGRRVRAKARVVLCRRRRRRARHGQRGQLSAVHANAAAGGVGNDRDAAHHHAHTDHMRAHKVLRGAHQEHRPVGQAGQPVGDGRPARHLAPLRLSGRRARKRDELFRHGRRREACVHDEDPRRRRRAAQPRHRHARAGRERDGPHNEAGHAHVRHRRRRVRGRRDRRRDYGPAPGRGAVLPEHAQGGHQRDRPGGPAGHTARVQRKARVVRAQKDGRARDRHTAEDGRHEL